MKKHLQAVWFLVVLALLLASATLQACPGCSADVAANAGLTTGFTYATLALMAVPLIAAVAVWRAIRRAIRPVIPAQEERNVTSSHDPDQD